MRQLSSVGHDKLCEHGCIARYAILVEDKCKMQGRQSCSAQLAFGFRGSRKSQQGAVKQVGKIRDGNSIGGVLRHRRYDVSGHVGLSNSRSMLAKQLSEVIATTFCPSLCRNVFKKFWLGCRESAYVEVPVALLRWPRRRE